jgi:sigma-E factor negative regulatory protein RseB
MMRRAVSLLSPCLLALVLHGNTVAQTQATDTPLNTWLARVHQASSVRSFTGTYVVSSEGRMSSARIWHVCDGAQQVERVDSLTGTPRATFRRNDRVVTFFPDSKIAVTESRRALGIFPDLLKSTDATLATLYQFKPLGSDRLAGLDADVVQLMAQDGLRYSYRVWNEKKSGLVLQLQTLDVTGKVLEQSAFSELRLDVPVDMAKLIRTMDDTQGYRVVQPQLVEVDAQSLGWTLRTVPAGFRAMGGYQRSVAVQPGSSGKHTLQWIFSDGLATVSLFVETFDTQRHVREGLAGMGGATHTLTRRMNDWWITAVGEVPPATLVAFAQALEYKK